MRALVVQMGARRGYEVARMLAGRGALALLQTDAAWAEGSRAARLAAWLAPGRAAAAVARRTVVGIPPERLAAALAPNLAGLALTAAGLNPERRFRVEDWVLGTERRLRGTAGANTVVAVAGNGGIDLLRHARRRGLKVAADIVITPLVHEILAEEAALRPGWGAPAGDAASRRIFAEHVASLADVCDLLICPSQFVADGLLAVAPQSAGRIALVPYALGGAAIAPGTPVPGRVLFAGEASARKGLADLARAALILARTRPAVEVRVAGRVAPAVRARPECARLAFLGHLSAAALAAEFARADVFVLPSLAEGMASVVLEALARAVPCVVTPAAGAPVRDGAEGRVVPVRDPEALAAAVAGIVDDRALRARMAAAALGTAARHEPAVVADALHGVLAALHRAPAASAASPRRIPQAAR